MEKTEDVLAHVLRKVTPNGDERRKIAALAKKLEKRVSLAALHLGVDAKVRVEGSVAKDTWLSDKPDVDVFMRVSPSIPKAQLGAVCLQVAREATEGARQVERFAEHPYLEAFVEGTRVNIVPCYETHRGEWHSATDRTPFHTDYVNERLADNSRGEVRLLKRFMKGIGVYGAEIKIGGFSGYLCELLILYYGSFLKAVEAFAAVKQRLVVDIERFYAGRKRDLDLLFDEPLVVVDPVDKARNVASAVRKQRLFTLVAASQTFLRKPSRKFFYPPRTVPFSPDKVRTDFGKRGSKVVFVNFASVSTVPDILWGQLFKSQRSLRKLLELNDFRVLRDLPWSDEKKLNAFVFELEDCCVSPVKLHLGPPLDKLSESERFISKHQGKVSTICGPYIEDGRWVVMIKRKYTDACTLLRERLSGGGKSAGVAEGLSTMLNKGFDVFVNEEVLKIYQKNKQFATFLTDFLVGKPKWLMSSQG